MKEKEKAISSHDIKPILPDQSNRDWTEDYDNYQNRCNACNLLFYGNKYRRTCKVCDVMYVAFDKD